MVTSIVRSRQGQVVLSLVLLLLPICTAFAGAEAPGEIMNTEGKPFKGVLRWKSQNRVYIVKSGGPNSATAVEFEVPLNMVQTLRVAEPAELAQAYKLLQENKLTQAIAVLDKLAQDYAMLTYDLRATRWLSDAYLRDGKPLEAVRACERVMDKRKELALSGEVAPSYWQALLAAGRFNKLEELLDLAAKSAAPEGLARAYVLRGELLRKQGKQKDALRDGYLRTVVLYKEAREPAVREARAEALYKAAQCLDELGQIQRATEMRTKCLNEHGESAWAQRVKAGERS